MPVRSLDLHRALAGGEFALHYQPIMELADGSLDRLTGDRLGARVAGVEALVRWLDPEHGLTSPQKFIPLAEETGLILPIGRWVIHQACRQASAWNAGRPARH